jgi:hypothetical protein
MILSLPTGSLESCPQGSETSSEVYRVDECGVAQLNCAGNLINFLDRKVETCRTMAHENNVP